MPSVTPSAFLSRGAHLRLDGVSKSYPDRRVLTDITLTVSQGERLALIGENGTGKSTLLRIAAGVEPADCGSVQAPGRVGLLWQQPAYALSDTVAQVVEQACVVPLAILREFEEATVALEHDPHGASERYDRALEAATGHDVWNLDHRAQVVLDGVGLAGVSWRRRAGELSGGSACPAFVGVAVAEPPGHFAVG
ncbi:Uncharacterized ABC transporter ATP-binding protein HI_1252 [Dermatophilus congolensis]|uniref:Uncharacterized ABC transporter ATP-binding protein HI_1252 n=1 Tax=Dermatophilus congolensis TaxID=1863 RepID=A0AA46BMJ9_9MICO|nr:ATP-binding cassette domain-containing protein [Dermatophilus congolensis]STD07586.1 Uncharacterized ABC transporter ATP-binding protein HI_1252 [Dermatophilus congolensis]